MSKNHYGYPPPPNTHIKVKSQGYTKVKNVQNMLSHGDTPICQNLVCLCQRAKTSCQTQIHGENIILILRSKVKVIQSSWMYVTHYTMVIHSHAKQSMTLSKDKKVEDWTQSYVKNPINLILRSKVKVVSGSWMYWTLPLMVIDPCAKYGTPMSKLTEVTRWTWRHDDMRKAYKWPGGQKSSTNREHYCTTSHGNTPMCEINIVSHCKPKLSHGPDRNLHRQIDRVIPIYPPELCSWGVKLSFNI